MFSQTNGRTAIALSGTGIVCTGDLNLRSYNPETKGREASR